MPQVSGSTLQKVENIKDLGVVLTSDGRWNERLIHGLVKQAQFCASFYHFVVTKRELSNTAKLSVFKSVFVLILIHGHEPSIMTEIKSSQVQAERQDF